MMASGRNGTLYVGMTSSLVKRVYEHKNDLVDGFTKRYGAHDLVWFEQHGNAETATTRERQIKEWQRAWKIRLIIESNPGWRDLYGEIVG